MAAATFLPLPPVRANRGRLELAVKKATRPRVDNSATCGRLQQISRWEHSFPAMTNRAFPRASEYQPATGAPMQPSSVSCNCSGRKGLAMKSWAPFRMASEISLVWFRALTTTTLA